MNSEQSIHLSEYYLVLTKHKFLILASFVIVVTLTLLFSFLTKSVYQAAAVMVIDKQQNTSPLTGERLDYESYVSESLTFNTHFKLITSRAVLEKVIRNLKLDQPNPDREKLLGANFLIEFLRGLKKNLYLLFGKDLTPTLEEELSGLIEKLQEKIDIEQVRDTRILNLKVEDHDPALARDIANNLAKVYIEFDIDNRVKSSRNTLSWMSAQLYEMKKKLEDAEEEFLAYKQSEKLFSIAGRQKVIDQKIEEFNDAYLQTRNKRLELDAKLAELERSLQSKGSIIHVRSLAKNDLIESLYAQLLEAEMELTRLGKIFKDQHPKITQAESKLNQTQKKLDEELEKVMENLRAERTVLYNRENVFQKTITDFENDALDTSKKELKYGILQRNVDTNKKLYDTLLSKIEESHIVDTLDTSNIRIVQEAPLPLAPVKPKKRLNFILSIIFGLMTGVSLAFFLEYLDQTLRTEDDVQRYLGLPVLSVIPVADEKKAAPETK
uniref:GumC family protein n=1 Tax=Candidatus Desulfatibia profunda TaxID=2841695 RepID=A0A8J6NRC1_9BACT|nr:GumC family protein [Candidatus Desulfatibia profunda]